MACTDDGGAKAIGHRAGPKAPTGGHSAHLLRAPTLADVLRQQVTPTPRVVSMSMKPRAAIMLAGHAGDAVLWYTARGRPDDVDGLYRRRRFRSPASSRRATRRRPS